MKEPATGLPLASTLNWPEGMKNAAIQTTINTTVRMVTGAGNPRLRFSRGALADPESSSPAPFRADPDLAVSLIASSFAPRPAQVRWPYSERLAEQVAKVG